MCIFGFCVNLVPCVQCVAGAFCADALCQCRRNDPHKAVGLCAFCILVRCIFQRIICGIRTVACGTLFPVQQCRCCGVQTFVLKHIIRLEPVISEVSLFQSGRAYAKLYLICVLVCGYIKSDCINISSLVILHAKVSIRDLGCIAHAVGTCILDGSSAAARECDGFFISQLSCNDAAVCELCTLQCCIPQLEGDLALFCQSFAVNDLFRNVPGYGEVAAQFLLCQVCAAADGEVTQSVAPLYASVCTLLQRFRTNVIVPIADCLCNAAFAAAALQTSLFLSILSICQALISHVQTAAVHKAVYIYIFTFFAVHLNGNA